MGDAKQHTTDGPGEPDRNPPEEVAGGAEVHKADESHPAGDGQRSEDEAGGSTSREDAPGSEPDA